MFFSIIVLHIAASLFIQSQNLINYWPF